MWTFGFSRAETDVTWRQVLLVQHRPLAKQFWHREVGADQVVLVKFVISTLLPYCCHDSSYWGNNVKLVMHQISVDKIENPCY